MSNIKSSHELNACYINPGQGRTHISKAIETRLNKGVFYLLPLAEIYLLSYFSGEWALPEEQRVEGRKRRAVGVIKTGNGRNGLLCAVMQKRSKSRARFEKTSALA